MLRTEQAEKERRDNLPEREDVFFSPSSIVAIFNAATTTREEKKIIQVRGIFKKTGTANYAGNFYNRLKDEASDNSITLLTPALLHHPLDDNKTIEFNGFITRRVDKLGRIELIINLVELLSQRMNKFSEEEAKKILLINQKVGRGFRDLDAHIKNAIFHQQRISIKVIMGRSGIIDTDINEGMESATALYDISYHRIALSSPDEIMSSIAMLDKQGADLICVARGGGDNLAVFEDLELCQSIIETDTIIASAIGHAQDVTLFEKLADKKFITPTQFGHYLKEIYDRTIEELEQSKAKLVRDITAQLSAGYTKQIENLSEQIRLSKELHDKTILETRTNHLEQVAILEQQLKGVEALMNKTTTEKDQLHLQELTSMKHQVLALQAQQIQKDRLIEQSENVAANYQRQLNEARAVKEINWRFVTVAVLAGLILGWLLSRAV